MRLLVIEDDATLRESLATRLGEEGFAIEQVLSTVSPDEVFFWATHQGAEIDLILRHGSALFGVECKRTDTPRMTPSIRIALKDLELTRIAVLYPGTKRFPISEQVEAVPLHTICSAEPIFSEDSLARQ